MSVSRPIEIRCPIYGFIKIDGWEHDIIEQPAFQRLRRIRQLAWSDYVYPGAMHTRFEHCLGVMHMASQLYDGIVERCWDRLQSDLGYNQDGKNRFRRLVRLAALLHDVGHGPFSHAAEELAPQKPGAGRSWQHEEYSTAIIRRYFKDVIENHKENSNYNLTVEEVAGLIEGGAAAGKAAIWQDLVSGQLDADRMDYLLRDSYHAGVEYGRYDWRRIAATVTLAPDVETETLRLAISESGRHAAEALLIARYMMFNQVYYHKTRVILDHHLHHAVEAMLPEGQFPSPQDAELDQYLEWDDWRVLGRLADGGGGEHGACLRKRDFYRMVWETPEFPNENEIQSLDEIERKLAGLTLVRCEASKSWYKMGPTDLLIAPEIAGSELRPLSQCSTLMRNMKPMRRVRLYVASAQRAEAEQRIQNYKSEERR